MNGIERLRDLVAAGEKATLGRVVVVPLGDQGGLFLLRNQPDGACVMTWEAEDVVAELAPVCCDEPDTPCVADAVFMADAFNARQAISDVVALVEAVGRWREHGRTPRFDKELMEAYEKLTRSAPQHVCHLTGYNPMIDPRCPGCAAKEAK